MPESASNATEDTVCQDAATWFEIPTTDLERATLFYELLLNDSLRRETFGETMHLFPAAATAVGGSLVRRDLQKPSASGTIIYLNCRTGLAAALERMKAGRRGEVIIPITKIPGGLGHFAVIRDSEGNHVGLHEH